MEVGEFLKTVGKAPASPTYLFTSHKAPKAREATFEPLLAQRAADALVKRFVDPSMKDLSFHSYYGDDANPSEIVSVAQTLPFLTDYRVIFLNNADRFETEAAGKVLHAYIASPCDTTILIMIAPRIDRRLKLFKLCEKSGVVVECPEMQKREAGAWAREEIKARGKRIEANAAQLLVDRSGTRLSDIDNAITVVCNYVGEKATIEEIDVLAACADVAEDEVWALTDAIANSDTKEAMRVLRSILDLGMAEFEILGTVTWLIKSAYLVASGNGNRLSPFVAKKFKPLADKLGREKFRDAFTLLINTEVMLRSTGVDRTLALELLVIKLAAPRRPARAS